MNDSEIIELLETCGEIANCKKCSFYNAEKNNCLIKLNTYALDFIKRQQAGIEFLKTKTVLLESEKALLTDANKNLHKKLKIAKSEAVMEFAKKLKEKLKANSNYGDIYDVVAYDCIDKLMEEMGCSNEL